MVKEKLTFHQVEWEVVEGPAKYCRADLVIETLEGDVAVIVAAALPTQSCDTLEKDIDNDG